MKIIIVGLSNTRYSIYIFIKGKYCTFIIIFLGKTITVQVQVTFSVQIIILLDTTA
jgi:hypothetical protein